MPPQNAFSVSCSFCNMQEGSRKAIVPANIESEKANEEPPHLNPLPARGARRSTIARGRESHSSHGSAENRHVRFED